MNRLIIYSPGRPITQLFREGGAKRLLDESPFGERHRGPVADHDVVEQTNVDQRQGFLDAVRDELVRLTRLGDSGGMIVRNDDRGAVPVQGALHDFPRVYARALRLAFSECL